MNQTRGAHVARRGTRLGLIVVSATAWLLGLAVAPQPAQAALVFSDFIDFDGPGLGPGNHGSIQVSDGKPPPPWLHDITDNLGGQPLSNVNLLSGKLYVSYRRVGAPNHELWTLYGDGISLGVLPQAGNTIRTEVFPLSPEALAALDADGLLNVVPVESTRTHHEKFRLYEARLIGEYTIVPEPLSVWLFGLGALGGGLSWRRRRSRNSRTSRRSA